MHPVSAISSCRCPVAFQRALWAEEFRWTLAICTSQEVARVTDRATSSSEEVAASSERLGTRAGSLGELVERFRTSTTPVGR
jgi:hypothetical protein